MNIKQYCKQKRQNNIEIMVELVNSQDIINEDILWPTAEIITSEIFQKL